jgi:hypothetical protein
MNHVPAQAGAVALATDPILTVVGQLAIQMGVIAGPHDSGLLVKGGDV